MAGIMLPTDIVNADVLAVDTETTGFHTYQDDVIRGISVAYRKHGILYSWYVPISHPDSENVDPSLVYDALRSTNALMLMHNSPFDLGVLGKACGFRPKPDHLYDTQVGDWLMDENLGHGLKPIGVRLFGDDADAEQRALKETGRDWATYTADDIAEYAAKDAELTYRVYEHQMKTMPDMVDSPLPDVRREMQLQVVIADMVRTGIRVDQERAERQYQEALARRDVLREHFASIQLPGMTDHKPPRPRPVGVNLNSSKQLAELIYDEWDLDVYLRTPGGKRSTSKEAIEPHAEVDPRVAEVLEHRRMDKACSGFYEPLARYVGGDGRIHPSFSSARTVTGRFTCSEPNLQTIPREDVLAGIRSCFIPATGTELWEFDLDSAELRIIGAMTKEPGIFSAMAEGRDLHSETAAGVFGENFTGLQRRLAKNMNYGYPYGIGADKLARYLAAGPPRRPMTTGLVAEAKAMKARYARTYPRMTAMMRALSDIAKRDGYLPLHKPGRYRRFRTVRYEGPDLGGEQFGKYYTALNALVQGAVAELMKDLMLEFAGNVDGVMCLQVHDSLVLEIAPGSGYAVQSQLQRIVDDCNPFPEMPMPIAAKEWGT